MPGSSPRHRQAPLHAGTALVLSLALSFGLLPGTADAQSPAPALRGTVSSPQEGAMEGVLVSAKKDGGTITVTVVSQAGGGYAFPAGRLAPGRYHLAIRASGYALSGDAAVEIGESAPTTADLTLKQVPVTAADLTNAELMANAPGSDELKRGLLNCTDCHSLQRIFQSTHTSAEFLSVFDRMGGYYPGASDFQPQRLNGGHRRPAVDAATAPAFADYLAGLNRSHGAEPHLAELEPFPRPSGAATRVIITEYDLPRPEIQPHDVVVDPDGMVWYSHFGEQFLSRLDPRTGQVTDFAIPVQKPDHPKGTLDLEVDHDGALWIGLMYQSGIARFDRATGTFRIFRIPDEWQTDATQQSHFSVAGDTADGKVWVKNSDRSQVLRLDLKTGQYENLGSYKIPGTGRPIGIYGIYADHENNAYILEFGHGGIGKIDAQTGKLSFYPTPTPFARARRGRVDAHDRLWFAEFGANRVGMFDPATQTITEWKKPLPWEAPYDVVADRFGKVWEVNESSDRLGRLDPATGTWTNYLLPHYSNLRRVFVDDRSPHVTVWTGNDHAAAIIALEPLD